MNTDTIIIRNAALSDIGPLVKLLGQLFSIEKDFIVNPDKQKQGLLMMLDGCGKHRSVKVAQYKGLLICSSWQTKIIGAHWIFMQNKIGRKPILSV